MLQLDVQHPQGLLGIQQFAPWLPLIDPEAASFRLGPLLTAFEPAPVLIDAEFRFVPIHEFHFRPASFAGFAD